ncbi:MAG: prolipoprotein diacylglyceryl transferase family protein, partial [Solirubrobacteraceae bacterium]
LRFSTFQPTFLYEMIWNLSLAGVLIWLGQTRRVRPPGLFALYVAGYSAFRMFEETLRIDYSNHILGLRLNFFVALALLLLAIAWFVAIQRGWRGLGGPRDGSDDDAHQPTAATPAGSAPPAPRLRAQPSGRGSRPAKRR